MKVSYHRWQRLFLVCFGIFIGSAFCLKWMETDLVQNGEKFTVIGLEISYSKEKLLSILSGLDPQVKKILGYHLSFDFVFMPGVYVGIAALCMMAKYKSESPRMKRVFVVAALLQFVAWACDIAENCYLLSWLENPVIIKHYGLYHALVVIKWVLAVGGALLAIPFSLKKKSNHFQMKPNAS